ncbi:fibronectin type III domain-containing protein [Nocardioides sp. GXZ039]|uniref:fibronectin type III domain-containing protein n=1 Tax=Nocardioides sp. GXZ039 TaxID=3136018 RepID=UPI0030F44E55
MHAAGSSQRALGAILAVVVAVTAWTTLTPASARAETQRPPTHRNAAAPAATAPTPPLNVTAVPGDQSAIVSWDPPESDGGAPITGYTVTLLPFRFPTYDVAGDVTSLRVTGLDNGQRYTFTVTATNSAGTSQPSAESAPVVPAAPPAPVAGVTAVAGDRSATVSWGNVSTDNGAQVTSFRIASSPSGVDITVPRADGFSAVVSGLTNGTTYTFRVWASNVAGESTDSAPSNPVTPAGLPTTVSGVKVVRGDQSATVTWSPAAGNGAPVTGYVVAAGSKSRTVPAYATSARLTGLTNGRSYRVTVAALNAVGVGAPSPVSSVVPAAKPGTPAKPTVKVKGRTLTVTWRPAADNGAPITSYVVIGGKPASKTVAGGVRKVVYKNLRPGTYKIRLIARNAVGASKASPSATARVAR